MDHGDVVPGKREREIEFKQVNIGFGSKVVKFYNEFDVVYYCFEILSSKLQTNSLSINQDNERCSVQGFKVH